MKLPFTLDLSGKTAVVTGAGGVLCSVFAEALALCGADVALLDINFRAAQSAAERINTHGRGRAIALQADVLSRESLDSACKAVLDNFPAIDILLNGAGGNNPRGTCDDESYDPEREGVKTFFDLDPEGIRFVFDLNILGVLLPTQVFARHLTGREGACIVNISSMNSFRPLTKIPAYSAAKSGVSNFTQWLATYFAASGVRVNALAPGFFVTNQNRGLLFTEDGSPTARTDKILAATPMGRFGEPEELVSTLLWLVCGASSFVTGVVVPVDGGFSAYSGV